MKISKKLIPTTVLTATSLISLSSCSKQPSEAEKIANAIFSPFKLSENKINKTFLENLKTLSSNELNNELIYDLFYMANVDTTFTKDKTIAELYENQFVALKTNIAKCDLRFDQDNLKASFLGYVSFVFIKKYTTNDQQITFDVNDYIMLTYEIDNFIVTPNNVQWGLKYMKSGKECLGFVKVRQTNKPDSLFYINEIDMDSEPNHKNSKNWVKA